ncbi:tail protein [Klebsiella phage vB_KvM-Eowyn]|uniref:YomR n=1 Tax=Klebsiella phage vB_KvM-Eowyn TaxID=2762819 RepID=A0A7R8R9L4_9CAUD|nr:tail protein [Klebsiella phage vB_KvM-Eowyn]CAD5236148.1 YomR [Klebsiella phage vB_KvM-Eowyn]
MSTITWTYPEDLTGEASSNLVSNEVHTVPYENTYAFVMNYGPFYGDSVVITKSSDGSILTKGIDYKCLYLYPEAVAKSGMPVYSVIQILDRTIAEDLNVTYQVVGGIFSSYAYALDEIIALLQIDNRSISWENILNKPTTFPPAPHIHDASDLYGLQSLNDAINDLKQAILYGDVASHDQIYDRIATVKTQVTTGYTDADTALQTQITQNTTDIATLNTNLSAQLTALSQTLTSHTTNQNNPHNTTYAQVGAPSITWTINGVTFNKSITLTPANIGALSTSAGGTVAGATTFNAALTVAGQGSWLTKTGVYQPSGTSDYKVDGIRFQANSNQYTDIFWYNTTGGPHTAFYVKDGSTVSIFRMWATGGMTIPGNMGVGSAVYQTDGNLTGTAWGGFLSDYLNNRFNTVSNTSASTYVRGIRFGAQQSFHKRDGTEYVAGGVMTAWADFGNSDYWVYLRPLQYNINGTWTTAPYT